MCVSFLILDILRQQNYPIHEPSHPSFLHASRLVEPRHWCLCVQVHRGRGHGLLRGSHLKVYWQVTDFRGVDTLTIPHYICI